jgi:hypothetical protein
MRRLERLAICFGDRQAGNGHCLAPEGPSLFLDMKDPTRPGRTTSSSKRGPRSDPQNQPRESALGCAPRIHGELLNRRFELDRVVMVGDRGMVKSQTRQQLREAGQGYLVDLQRRNRKDTYQYIREAEARDQWQECEVGMAASEKAYEGKYVLQTEERHLSPLEAVAAYKELNEVERGFSHLKGLLEVRPVYHRSAERVQSHVLVAALAFLLDRAMEKKLKAGGSTLSSPFAWRALESVRCVEVQIGDREKLCLTRGSRHAAEVLKALGITQLDPPEPPVGQEAVM